MSFDLGMNVGDVRDEFELVPEGDYVGQIVDAAVIPKRYETGVETKTAHIKIKITEGPHEGSVINDFVMFYHSVSDMRGFQLHLKELLACTRCKDMSSLEELPGKPVAFRCYHDSYKGSKPKARVVQNSYRAVAAPSNPIAAAKSETPAASDDAEPAWAQ